MSMPRIVVAMGVSGSGKSSVGAALAVRLSGDFLEGDALHPAANVAKMHAGHPLDDADRTPWLDAIGAWMADDARVGRWAVVSCSALKRAYRDRLRAACPRLAFVLLAADHDTLLARMQRRTDHFMPSALLDSQLATLEPPAADECALTLDATQTVEASCDAAIAWLEGLSD